MQKYKSKLKIFLGISFVILLFAFLFLILSRLPKTTKNYDSFARCLAEEKLTMYGAYWCPHCQNEKKAFGDSFKFVPYIECTQETKRCLEKGVDGYPTWIDASGTKYEGEQGLGGLARLSGCGLPD